MEKVKEILKTSSGSGAKGPWQNTQFMTESDKKASTFDAIEVGDTVELGTYSSQYKTWSATKAEKLPEPEPESDGPGEPTEWVGRQTSIEKQSARKDAVAAVSNYYGNFLTAGDSPPSQDEYIKQIEKFFTEFLKWTN